MAMTKLEQAFFLGQHHCSEERKNKRNSVKEMGIRQYKKIQRLYQETAIRLVENNSVKPAWS